MPNFALGVTSSSKWTGKLVFNKGFIINESFGVVKLTVSKSLKSHKKYVFDVLKQSIGFYSGFISFSFYTWIFPMSYTSYILNYLYQNQSIGRKLTAPDTNCIVKSLYH